MRPLDLTLDYRQQAAKRSIDGIRIGKHLGNIRFEKDDLAAFFDAVDVFAANTTPEVIVI